MRCPEREGPYTIFWTGIHSVYPYFSIIIFYFPITLLIDEFRVPYWRLLGAEAVLYLPLHFFSPYLSCSKLDSP